MKKKLTNIEVLTMMTVFDQLGVIPLPVKLSYAITKNKRLLVPEYEDCWDQLKQFSKQFGEDSDEFLKAQNELFNMMVEVDFYMVEFDIEDLLNDETRILTSQQLEVLMLMITHTEEIKEYTED